MSDKPFDPPSPERRRFLQWCTRALGGLWATLFSLPIVAYLIDARHRAAQDRAYKTVARLSDLRPNEPYQAVVRDIRRDAWTLHPNDVIGRVWLIRRDGNTVEAYTTTCPHLGCSINYEEGSKKFICPCHLGTWDARCKLVPSDKLGRQNAAPRGMDALDVRVNSEADLVQVKYQTFKRGEPTKEPIS